MYFILLSQDISTIERIATNAHTYIDVANHFDC